MILVACVGVVRPGSANDLGDVRRASEVTGRERPPNEAAGFVGLLISSITPSRRMKSCCPFRPVGVGISTIQEELCCWV